MHNKASYKSNSVIGVFIRCTEDFTLVPREADYDLIRLIEGTLHTTVIPVSVDGSSVIGSLSCGNSTGFLISERVTDTELNEIKRHIPAKRLNGILNTAGNNILVNDTAALVNPNMSDRAVEKLHEFLGVDVYRGTIAGLKTVGMAACATNKSILVHPGINQYELDQLEKIFGLPVDIGTVNMGIPLIGSGLLANSKGFIAGGETTGHEIGRIEDALGTIHL
jgi:translation initiation factor 6